MKPLDELKRSLCVLGHPNHEFALFGMMQRSRPHLLYLTDGGGAHRVAETQRALERTGLADRAVFLNLPETSFYQALLERDFGFYRTVVDAIRRRVRETRPERVYCEAVEFYNPVHDVTLPLVMAALDGDDAVDVWEFPLIHQTDAGEETYLCQRFPEGRTEGDEQLTLTPGELAAKLEARAQIYHALRAQMGSVLEALDAEHLSVEDVGPARDPLRAVASGQVMRYERRGRLLQQRGEVQDVITWADHFVPFVRAVGLAG